MFAWYLSDHHDHSQHLGSTMHDRCVSAIFLPLLLLLVAAHDASAQSTSHLLPVRFITTDLSTRTLEFFVWDRSGEQISDLRAGDVRLTENRSIRPILALTCPETEANRALSSVLTIDVSSSMRNGRRLEIAAKAARTWIDRLPLGYSEAALITFNHDVEVLHDLTTDRRSLLDALDLLDPTGGTSYEAGLIGSGRGGIPVAARGTRKRVVIFLTDGVSAVDAPAVIDEAQRAAVEVHVVVVDMEAPESLQRIAAETGGLLFDQVSNVAEAERVFSLIQTVASGGEPCRMTWEGEPGCGQEVRVDIDIPFYGVSYGSTFQIAAASLPRLVPERTGLSFGVMPIGSSVVERIRYRAVGRPVTITSVDLPSGPFEVTATDPPLPATLAPGSALSVDVRYRPTTEQFVSRRLRLVSTACGMIPLACTGGRAGEPEGKSIRILHPNGGEIFPAGGMIEVRWDGIDLADTVALEFSRDAGRSWELLTDRATGGLWQWESPTEPSRSCLVRVRPVSVAGERGRTILRCNDRVWSVAWSPTGELVATASEEGVVRFWDPESGELISTPVLPAELLRPNHLAFSPDGSLLAITGGGPTIYVLSVLDGTTRSINVGRVASGAAFDRSTGELITTTSYGELIRYDPASGVEVSRFGPDLFGTIRSVALASDPCRVLVGGVDLLPRLFDCADGRLLAELPEHRPGVEAVDFSGDGGHLLTAGLDGDLRLYGQPTDLPVWTFSLGTAIFAARFSPDDRSIAVGGLVASPSGAPIRLLDRGDGSIERILVGHSANVESIDWDPGGRRLLSGSWDSTAIIWDLDHVPAAVDASDRLWSIVPSSLATRDVNFGPVTVGTTIDSTVDALLCNDGEYPIEIDSIVLDDPRFAIRSNVVGTTLAPGDCLAVELSCAPDRSGTISVRYRVSAGSMSWTGELRCEGSSVTPIEPSIVDFGRVEIDTARDTTLVFTIDGCGKTGTELQGIELVGAGASSFTLSDSPSGPVVFDGILQVSLRYMPTRRGFSTARLRFDCSCEYWAPEERTYEVRLLGEGICPDRLPDARALVAGDLTAAPGDRLAVPVLLGRTAPRPGTPRRYRLVVSFDRRLIAPTDRNAASVVSEGRTTMILEGEWDGRSDTLASIDLIVGLGSATNATLAFDRLIFENDCEDLYAIEEGMITYDGLCPDPEHRFFLETDSLYLRPVTPDPVRSSSIVRWRLIEEGRMALRLIDAQGRVVRTLDEGERGQGEYAAEILRAGLPSGVYFLRLQTATQDLIRPVVVD